MPSSFGFRLLQGKGSASGHLRTGEDAIQVQCRGLLPGESYSLYRSRTFLESRRADPQGLISFTAAADGFFFLCDQKMRPVLWETGEDGPAGYYRALALLPKPAAEKKAEATEKEQAVSIKGHGMEDTSPADGRNMGEAQQAAHLSQMDEESVSSLAADHAAKEPILPATEGTKKTSPTDIREENNPFVAEETVDKAETSAPRYRLHFGQYRIPGAALHPSAAPLLRAPSAGPMACALPPLQWPDSLLHIQSALRCGQPFSNLGHPGFRCVKLPSPNPAFPYCVVGYQTRESHIAALLYALPGHPMMPPRGFANCRFQQNHWLRVQYLP